MFAGNDNVVVGCRFYSGGYGGAINGNRNSINGVSGNAGTQHGLYVSPGADNVISGCMFQGYTNDGVRLTGNADNTVVANCRCVGNGGYGINIATSDCDKNLIHGNICLGNTTGAINNLGTGTVLADNITA